MLGRFVVIAALVGCAAPPKPRAARPMPEPTPGPYEGVDETIARERGRMKECFNRALAADQRAGGRYKIRFEIGATGAVTGAWVASAEGTPSLGECIRRSFLEVTFPPPASGRLVVTVPFVLTSTYSRMLCTREDDVEQCDLLYIDAETQQALSTKKPDDVLLIFREGARNPEVSTAALYPPARSIAIRSHYVDDVSSLAPLKALELLALTPTSVRDVSVVRSLPRLRVLYLPATADPTPAFDVQALTTLGLARDLADWTPLAKLKSLTTLQLLDTQLADLSPLVSVAPALRRLRLLRPALLTELAPVAKFGALEELAVTDSKVTNLAPLSAMPSLKVLDLSRSPVSDLSPLAKHTGLVEVRLGGTKVTELWPLLASATSLQTLVVPATMPDAALASFRAKNPSLKTWRE